MGCGASKTQGNNVVESHQAPNPKTPEKSRSQSPTPAPTPAPPTTTPPTTTSAPESHDQKNTNSAPTAPPNQTSSPAPSSTLSSSNTDSSLRKTALTPIPTSSVTPNTPAEPNRTPPSLLDPLPPRAFPRKGEVLEIDLGVPKSGPVSAPRTAVQERLEKYAEERKVAALTRPSTANIDRKLADAEERRKAQTEQKLKKVKLKNQDVEERGEQLKQLEDKKAQELMHLIKSKNIQATQKRQAIQQEVKNRAEEEAAKAKEVAAKKSASASQTPVDTPHDTSSIESEDSKKSILETPLPPLATGAH